MIENPIVRAKLAIISSEANLMIEKCSIGPSSKGSVMGRSSIMICSPLIEHGDDNSGD